MKKYFRALLLLLCFLMLFSACASKKVMEYKDGVYTDPATGNTYVHAPLYYEAVAYEKSEDDFIAHLNEKSDVKIYRISNIDQKEMVCTGDNEVLCAEGYSMPAFWDLEITKLRVAQTDVITVSTIEITDVNDLSLIAEIYGGLYFSADEIAADATRVKYDLKFMSSNLSGIYYCLNYWRFAKDVLVYEDVSNPDAFVSSYPGIPVELYPYNDGSGDYYAEYNFGKEILFDRVTNRCFVLGDVLSKHMDAGESHAE